MTQCVPLSGLHPANSSSLRTRGKKTNKSENNYCIGMGFKLLWALICPVQNFKISQPGGHVISQVVMCFYQVVMCSAKWWCIWSGAHVFGQVTMCLVRWSCVLSDGHVFGQVVLYFSRWSCVHLWGHLFRQVPMCLARWLCVWIYIKIGDFFILTRAPGSPFPQTFALTCDWPQDWTPSKPRSTKDSLLFYYNYDQ